MKKRESKIEKRITRHRRVRSRVHGTASRPRFSVFRSNKYIFVQLIDDDKKRTTLSLSSKTIKGKTKAERAYNLGKEFASLARKKNIRKTVFDRGGNKYHGRVKAVAEGAREAGLMF